MPARLSKDQVEFFHREGYLIYNQPVLKPNDFAALKEHFERKLADWEKTSKLSSEHMDSPHFTDPKLFDWLMNDDLLDIVESLIGPDIMLWASHFISKPAGRGKRVPWHEDSAYWGKALDPMEVVTIWLAIDPATPENGCMRVIPRTHHHGYSAYKPVGDKDKSVFSTEIEAHQIDESKAVDCILQPNQCSIHHAKLIHGSAENRGAMRRCGYTMRYSPATTAYRPDAARAATGFKVYLARGQDRAGNSYGKPWAVNEDWRVPPRP